MVARGARESIARSSERWQGKAEGSADLRKCALPLLQRSIRSSASWRTGLLLGRHRSLLAKMPKPKTKKRNRVKGVASRGFFRRWKWIWIVLLVLLIIPAMQVAVVRFVNPPRTLPMCRVKGFASRGSGSGPRKRASSHATVAVEKKANVLRLRVAVGERRGVLHRLLNQSARAAEAASRGREFRDVSPRSVEANLLRGVFEPGRRSRTRKVS
jgi:hypothetical protein